MDWDIVDKVNFQHVYVLFADAIKSALKELVEKKHLYQNIEVQWPDPDVVHLKGSPRSPGWDAEERYWNEFTKSAGELLWFIDNPQSSSPYEVQPQNPSHPLLVPFTPFTVKSYCEKCEGINPFNFRDGSDAFAEDESYWRVLKPIYGRQVFILKYECQGCKVRPEVFLVARKGTKISLVGRDPMEQVLVPKYIPKDFAKYYSSALIAFNSGQILPAKFMFRVFIEQFIRSVSINPKSDDIEALFTEYKSGLARDFKQRAPSLEKIYKLLSDHIHEADETPEIVPQVQNEIDLHFEAKKLYERMPHTDTSTGDGTSNVNPA